MCQYQDRCCSYLQSDRLTCFYCKSESHVSFRKDVATICILTFWLVFIVGKSESHMSLSEQMLQLSAVLPFDLSLLLVSLNLTYHIQTNVAFICSLTSWLVFNVPHNIECSQLKNPTISRNWGKWLWEKIKNICSFRVQLKKSNLIDFITPVRHIHFTVVAFLHQLLL
jgi:hypothetical protein